MSNGDSGDEEQEPLGPPEFGTNFTVNLRQIELTPEQRDAISSDIIDVIIASIGKQPTPPEIIELIEGFWRTYRKY